MFKKWNAEYPLTEEENDGVFLSYLLGAVFGHETLKRSSAFGGRANHSGVTHEALDAELLDFIKST